MCLVRSLALGPSAGFADVASALELQFITAVRTWVDDLLGSCGLLGFLEQTELFLHLCFHLTECISDGHGTATSFAGVLLGGGTYGVRWARTAALELSDDLIDVTTAPCGKGDHPGESDHEVVASSGGSLVEVCFHQVSGNGVEECCAMQASASGHELPLLSDDVIEDLCNDSSSSFIGLRFLLLLGGEDSETFASVPEHGDSFASDLPCVHVQVIDVLLREVLGEVDCGTDGRIYVHLPGSLHVESLSVIEVLCGDEELREILIIGHSVFVHVCFDDRGVYLVIFVVVGQGCSPPDVVRSEDGFDSSGDSKHGGKCSGGCDGQEL